MLVLSFGSVLLKISTLSSLPSPSVSFFRGSVLLVTRGDVLLLVEDVLAEPRGWRHVHGRWICAHQCNQLLRGASEDGPAVDTETIVVRGR